MKLRLLQLLSLAYPFFGYAQERELSYTEKYMLDFDRNKSDTIIYPFLSNASYSRLGLFFFKAEDGNWGEKKVSDILCHSMRSVLRNRILLPDVLGRQKGCISLGVKGKDLKEVSVRLQGLDYKEEIVFDDTLSCVPDTFYLKLQGTFPLDKVDMLDVTVDTKGKEGGKSQVVFSNLEISLDGVPVDSFPLRTLPEFRLESEKLISIQADFGGTLQCINELQGKKIIGLGESVHYQQNIDRLVFRLMEEGIRSLGCRLLVFELPIELSLFCNRYISDPSYVIPEHISDYRKICESMDFFNRLRHYNAHCPPESRVRLFGMDYETESPGRERSLVRLFDFLSALNEEKAVPAADNLSLMFYADKTLDALNYLQSHRQSLREVLTEDELLCMEHILSFNVKIGKDPVERSLLRDWGMAENLAFLENRFAGSPDSKVMVNSHAGHLNRVSAFPIDNYRSTGSYLQEKYGELYAPFLLLVDNGSFQYKKMSGETDTWKLQCPYPESPEAALNQSGEHLCYYALGKEDDRLTLSRSLGASFSWNYCQFYPFNLYRRYDGVFYVKGDVKPVSPVSRTPEEELKITEELCKKALLVIQHRKAMADRIKSRCR